MTMSYARSLPGEVLLEVQESTDGSGRYFSDWADTTGFSTIRIYAFAPGLTSSTGMVFAHQGFGYPEPATPQTMVNDVVPVVSNPDTLAGGYYALAEVSVYERAVQIEIRGATANQQALISIRGVK